MTITKKQIKSSTMGDGSFGIRAKHNGDPITVWFCGGYIGDRGTHGNSSGPCVHRTRKDAMACPAVDQPAEYDAPELSGRKCGE